VNSVNIDLRQQVNAVNIASMAKPRRPRKLARPAKKTYHHGDLRRALLDAGLALIEEQGAQAFTLREAARRAGVSQAAPYRHFADKGALLAAIAEEGFRALSARMREEVARAAAPAGTLEPIGMGYLLFAVENPAHYRVMFGPGRDREGLPASAEAAGQESFSLLLDGVREAQRSGAIRSGDATELALFAWAIVHGLALLVIDGCIPVESGAFRVLAAHMLRLSFEGMAARDTVGPGGT
jgi:AcrR family transcriptional regulator